MPKQNVESTYIHTYKHKYEHRTLAENELQRCSLALTLSLARPSFGCSYLALTHKQTYVHRIAQLNIQSSLKVIAHIHAYTYCTYHIHTYYVHSYVLCTQKQIFLALFYVLSFCIFIYLFFLVTKKLKTFQLHFSKNGDGHRSPFTYICVYIVYASCPSANYKR